MRPGRSPVVAECTPLTRAYAPPSYTAPPLLRAPEPAPAVAGAAVLRHTPESALAIAGAEESRHVPRARPYNRRLFVDLCRAADPAVALLVFGAVYVVANAGEMPGGLEGFLLLRLSLGNLLTLGAFAFAWQLLFLLFGLYDASVPRRPLGEWQSVAMAGTLGSLLGLAPAAWSRSGAFSVWVVLVAWPLTVAATLGVHAALRLVARRGAAHRTQQVIIVGSGPLALRLYREELSDPESPYDVLGFVDTNPEVQSRFVRDHLLGSLEELEQLLMHTVVDEVLIALPVKSHYDEILRVIEECERAGVQSRYSADVFPSRLAQPRVETPENGGQPAVAMKVVKDDYRLVVKRAIDIVASAVALVILSPLFALIAIAIKATNPGPAIFGQERYGWRKRQFTMYKFRTMVTNAEALQGALESRNEAAGPVFKIANDPRVTAFGRFLRKTSLDELPQLWNVLRGDMSLVGPRPLPRRDVDRFDRAALMRRFSVVPGVTCLWQISGRSGVSFDRWIVLDLEYIDRWSLALDMQILWRTIPAVVKRQGAV